MHGRTKDKGPRTDHGPRDGPGTKHQVPRTYPGRSQTRPAACVRLCVSIKPSLPKPNEPRPDEPDEPIEPDQIPDTPPTEPPPVPIKDPRPDSSPPGPLIA